MEYCFTTRIIGRKANHQSNKSSRNLWQQGLRQSLRTRTANEDTIDLDRLSHDRLVNRSFADQAEASVPKDAFRRVIFHGKESQPNLPLRREIDSAPFVPKKEAELGDRCREIFHVQVSGLARRLEQLHKPDVAIGISGGLDSTLALLVACKTFDYLKVPRSRIQTVTMPGFGTTRRTRDNALQLIGEAATSPREIDIRPLCFAEMKSLGHRPFGIDLERLTLEEFSDRLVRLPEDRKQDVVFENIQARVRTNLLMNTGFVIGTGDMSELALGWCTYNADHMSMYNPNVSIPKTLVRFLVRWAAQKEFSGRMRDILLDIADTPISPELLPTDRSGSNPQSTESAIGPYELHDFFLFFLLRYGMIPTKILFLASQAQFSQPYTSREIRHWLRVFLRRFVVSQFKRSCLPDGPKVGSVSLSPRGDWRMPSDLSPDFWVKDLADD
ncbi:MAG: NAD(+) synthase [Gemmataceae bacterium]